MSILREKFPIPYKIYQETIGEMFYEFILLGPFLRLISRWRLKKLESTLKQPIDIANCYRGIGLYKTIRPFQIKSEICELFNIIDDLNPKVVCEIGSDLGGTLYLWSKVMQIDGLIISVDLPRLYRKSLNRFFSSFFPNTMKTYFLRQNSHASKCISKIEKVLNGEKIDFLFIDGDHSYEGVKKDFSMYARFVKKGGIIVFHDIVKDKLPENICGVDKFWSEIKTYYKYREVIADQKQCGAGIGILFYEPNETFS